MYLIKNNVNKELIIKKSRFIGHLFKIDSLNEVNKILDDLKKEHKDATHICYAYLIDNMEKAYDDGEPSGTAGLPILDILKKNELGNTLAVVIRYFGGIKLGAGGLIRAYRNTVKLCLEEATIIPYKKEVLITLYAPFYEEKELNFLCKNYEIKKKNYDEEIIYQVMIPYDELDFLKQRLTNSNIKIMP